MVSKFLKPAVNTPVDWLLFVIEDHFSKHYDGDSLNQILMAEDSAHLRITYFQELLAHFNVEPSPFGEQGIKFIAHPPEYFEGWSTPFSEHKVTDIAQALLTLDDDLTKDDGWGKLKILFDDNRRTIQNCGKNIESIDIIMQQLCIGYRYYVIHHAFFHTKSEWELDQTYVLNDLHFKETIDLINKNIVPSNLSQTYSIVVEHCKKILCQEVNQLLDFAQNKAKNGLYLLHISYHLKNRIHILQNTPEYEFLCFSTQDIVLNPLFEYLKILNTVMNRINTLLLSLCERSKLGVIVGPLVIDEIGKLIREEEFSQFISLGALPIIQYINSPEMIKWVHDTIISVRVGEVEHLLNDSDNLSQLKSEIRKATHFRVRRNIIEQLFWIVIGQSSKHNQGGWFLKWFQGEISSTQEGILLFLQEEYLHALMCQVELIPNDQEMLFLEKFVKHPIFQPLPRVKKFSARNHQAQASLALSIREVKAHSRSQNILKEDPSLGHMDCPIEQDIIGDVSKRLADLIMHKNKTSRQFMYMVEILEHTYKTLMAPDFEVTTSIEEYAMSNDFKKVYDGIHHEKDIQLRLERILELFNYIQDNQHWDMKNKIFRLANHQSKRRHPQHHAIEALQKLYIECLAEILQLTSYHNDHDINRVYEYIVIPSLKSALFNNDLVPHLCKKARLQIEVMCQDLIND